MISPMVSCQVWLISSKPIRGRISAEYRKKVLMNLIQDFLTKNGITA
jgi:hypothetical protein